PTQDAAQALIERIRGGVALQTAARDAGFNVQIGEPRDRATIATAGGEALAEATFAAEEGELLTPVRSQLGWYVAQLDTIERTPARTLDQVSDQIADQLRVELRGQLLMELSENIEREVDGGTSLVDVANANGFEVLSIPGVTEDGMIFGGLQSIAPELRPIIATAFQMDESEPQLAVLPSGNEFVVFDVSDIVDSAAPPIDEVRSQVVAAWRRSEGAKLAKDAADRIQVAVEEGSTLRDAAIAENPQLAQVETIDISREELLSTAQGRVPSALVLMFSMAQGSTKVLEEQSDLGWFVVNLDTIEVPEIEDGNPALLNTQAQLSAALPGEYNAQLATAIRNEMGVERNEDAITAVRQALAGNN
ncbi:MAG: peptidylprolyl isomerase, partial [Pseudomonadota bacterium]